MRQRVAFQILLIGISISLLSGCGTSASYRPPFLPVKLVIDSAGNVSVVGGVSIVTFVGEFSIGAEYTIRSEPDSIMLILRDQNKGLHGLDTIYRVRTDGDEFVVVLNGETSVQVVNKRVIIDITNADVKSIEFKRAEDSGVKILSFYRPFVVMQKMIDKRTWLSSVLATLLFPVEVIAIPYFIYYETAYTLFGDVGLYGAHFLLMAALVVCAIASGKSDTSTFLVIIFNAVVICGFIITLLRLWLS